MSLYRHKHALTIKRYADNIRLVFVIWIKNNIFNNFSFNVLLLLDDAGSTVY